MSIALYNDDCFNILETLEDKSINLFLLDLPYGQTANKWDSIIDLDRMWIEIKRTITDNGMVVFFCTTKFGYKIIGSNENWFKYDIVWKKTKAQGFLNCKNAPLRKHEMIYVFSNPKNKVKDKTYNPQMMEGKPYKLTRNPKNDFKISNYNSIRHYTTNTTGDRFPLSIIEFSHDKIQYHPTQKPLKLLEWIIKTYTNEGDTVCDFTMGSGNTGIACQDIHRNFIGVEKDEEIFKLALGRFEPTKII